MNMDKGIIQAITDYTVRTTGCKAEEIEVKRIGDLGDLRYEVRITPKSKM